MTASNIKAKVHSDIHRVWKILLAFENYSKWQSDISKTEVLNQNQFIEYSKKGYKTVFTVTASEPYKRLELDMNNSNMKGHWVGIFTSKGDGTEIDFTEYVTAEKLFIKPFVKSFLRKQQAQFVSDLKNALI